MNKKLKKMLLFIIVGLLIWNVISIVEVFNKQADGLSGNPPVYSKYNMFIMIDNMGK